MWSVVVHVLWEWCLKAWPSHMPRFVCFLERVLGGVDYSQGRQHCVAFMARGALGRICG